jgi:hypothetical protein
MDTQELLAAYCLQECSARRCASNKAKIAIKGMKERRLTYQMLKAGMQCVSVERPNVLA